MPAAGRRSTEGAAGISAGIDMCLHVVEKLFGKGVAVRTARYMEYSWGAEKWG